MITYAITVANEEVEFKRLVDSLLPYLISGEEIKVLADKNKVTENIYNICFDRKIEVNNFDFNGDFSAFKNRLLSMVKTEYIFQIDADEQIPPSLLTALRNIARSGEYDCLAIPRINIVNGITEEHLSKYRWNINERGWIIFPDFQVRCFKNNGLINWLGKVHEQVVGYKNIAAIQAEPIEHFCILHVKDIAKQEIQNSFYETL